MIQRILPVLAVLFLAAPAVAQPVPALPKEPPSATVNSDPPTLYKQWWLAARQLHTAATGQAAELERLRAQLAALREQPPPVPETGIQYRRVTLRYIDMPVDRADGSPVPFVDYIYATRIEPLTAGEYAAAAPAAAAGPAPVPPAAAGPVEQSVTAGPFILEAELPARKQRSAANPETEMSALSSAGSHIAFWGPDQWLEYDLPAVEAGVWTMTLRVSNATAGSSIEVSVDGVATATVPVPATGGWTSWVDLELPLTLARGAHVVRLAAVTTGWVANIDTLEFTPSPAAAG